MVIFIHKSKTYQIEVKRKKMKRLILRCKDGHYQLSAPERMPEEEIHAWLDSLKEEQLLVLMKHQKIKRGSDFIYLFGKRYCVVWRPVGENKAVLRNQCLYVYASQGQKYVDTFLKEMLYDYIEKRISDYQRAGLISFMPTIQIQKMTSRCGVCFYTQHKVKFSLFLVHEPKSVIDSIIIHELGHFYYPNHSKDFYRWVNQYDKDYDISRQYLKNGGAGDDSVDEK